VFPALLFLILKFLATQLDKASAEQEQLELHAMKNFNDILEMRKEAQAIEEEILR
jgi:hypothetical protein